MSEQLDFRLPDEVLRPRETRKGRGPGNVLLVLILIGVVGFGVALLRWRSVPAPEPGRLDAERERALASRLENRGLNVSAAEAWLRYLAAAKLGPKEQAARYYDVGKLYHEAGDFERALVNYYRSEAVAEVEELAPELSRRKRECFRRLGNIAGLNRELEAMTSLVPAEGPKRPGGELVAEIGREKITMEDVNRRVDQLVELQLKQYAGFVSGEELNRHKEKLVDQFQSKEAKFQLLQEMIAQEVLLREAMKRGLDKKPENERTMEEFRRSFLSSQVLEAETEQKANVTESDLRDYYNAHKQDFREKAKVEVSQIVTEKEEDAGKVLAALKEGKSFEECAKAFSTDDATKEKGGEVEGAIEKGGEIPGIGRDADVHAHLFALKENEVSQRPLKAAQKFYVFKVRKLVPERIKTFEEVRADVERRKTQEKVREVREALMKRLEAEHNVIIHRSKFLPEKVEPEESPERNKGAGASPPGTI